MSKLIIDNSHNLNRNMTGNDIIIRFTPIIESFKNRHCLEYDALRLNFKQGLSQQSSEFLIGVYKNIGFRHTLEYKPVYKISSVDTKIGLGLANLKPYAFSDFYKYNTRFNNIDSSSQIGLRLAKKNAYSDIKKSIIKFNYIDSKYLLKIDQSVD